MRNIPLSVPEFDDEEWQAIKEPLESGWVTSGPFVKEFEESFAQLHNVRFASAVSNCTNALHLALLALGVGEGDEVIVPSFSWVSTANAVRYCGAEVVFVDVLQDTYNIDSTQLKEKITQRTKAIIPVHLFGLCAEMDNVLEIAGDIPLVEDAACAAGSMYKNRHAGTLGSLGCFSFHPRKSVTTGEGGMISTNNTSLIEIVNRLRNHGSQIPEHLLVDGAKPYHLADMPELGFNYRLSDLQAAIGVVQLRKLNKIIDYKDELAFIYSSLLKDVQGIHPPIVNSDFKHSWQAYVIRVEESFGISRNELMEKLEGSGIATRPGTQAIHMLSYYRKRYNLNEDHCPIAKNLYENTVALPLHTKMDGDDARYIVKQIKDSLK